MACLTARRGFVPYKLPAFQFYPGDWMKDPGVRSLSYHDRGVWIELLCIMHESDPRGELALNGEPMTTDDIARVLRITIDEAVAVIDRLTAPGVARVKDDGTIYSARMVRDEANRQAKAEAGRRGGVSRASKPRPETPRKAAKKPRREPAGVDWSSVPQRFNTPEVRAKHDEWQAYRVAAKWGRWKPQSTAQSFKKFEGLGLTPTDWIAAVDESMSNQWRGVFPPKGGGPGKVDRSLGYDAPEGDAL